MRAPVYAVAQRLGLLPIKIIQPRTYLLFTKAGQLEARQRRAELRESTDDAVRFVQYLSIPAAIALGLLAGPAIEVWLGPQYREAAGVIGVLCIAGVIEAWAFTTRMAVCGAGRPKLSTLLYGGEAALHVALGIVLASRYGALGMAWAVLISVVLMEAMLMLPLTYRQLGDAFSRRLVYTVRTVGLPAVVTGGLAWLIGHGGGPLYASIDAHGRILGLAVVAAAGIGLMIVFCTRCSCHFCLPPSGSRSTPAVVSRLAVMPVGGIRALDLPANGHRIAHRTCIRSAASSSVARA